MQISGRCSKKRRKRSEEDVTLNEIDQARPLQYITKLIMSHIKQAKNKYWMNDEKLAAQKLSIIDLFIWI